MPGVRSGLRWSVALLSFVILIGSGLAWASFRDFTSSIPHGGAVPLTAHDVDGTDQNILLVGNDSRAGASPAELVALGTQNDGGSENTDTMMLLHVPANGSKPTIISFPRDSWVDIPGYGKGKLNSAYGDAYSAARDAHKSELQSESAGLILTIKTLETLTGLRIDHYAQVNLLGFYRISNAIGGVTVCLNAAQNPSTDSDAFGRGYSGINLPKGVSVIKGSQALAFVRQRHGLPRGDLDRITRQQYFLSSAFHKVTSAGVLLNPFKLHDLLNAVGASLLTDPALDVLKLAQQFEAISGGNIAFDTVPNNGPQMIYPDGVATSIVEIDHAAMPAFVRTLQGLPADPALAGAKAAAPASVTADVLNGTAEAGWASANATRLKALGFHVDVIDSTNGSATGTKIEYAAGQQGAAKALARVIPRAELVLSGAVQRPTLVLGTDGGKVSGAVHPGAASTTAAAPASTAATRSTAAAAAVAKPATPAPGLGCIN